MSYLQLTCFFIHYSLNTGLFLKFYIQDTIYAIIITILSSRPSYIDPINILISNKNARYKQDGVKLQPTCWDNLFFKNKSTHLLGFVCRIILATTTGIVFAIYQTIFRHRQENSYPNEIHIALYTFLSTIR